MICTYRSATVVPAIRHRAGTILIELEANEHHVGRRIVTVRRCHRRWNESPACESADIDPDRIPCLYVMEITDREFAHLELLLRRRILAYQVIAADLLKPGENGVGPEESKIGFEQKSSYRLARPSGASPPGQRCLPDAFRDHTAVSRRYG